MISQVIIPEADVLPGALRSAGSLLPSRAASITSHAAVNPSSAHASQLSSAPSSAAAHSSKQQLPSGTATVAVKGRTAFAADKTACASVLPGVTNEADDEELLPAFRGDADGYASTDAESCCQYSESSTANRDGYVETC